VSQTVPRAVPPIRAADTVRGDAPTSDVRPAGPSARRGLLRWARRGIGLVVLAMAVVYVAQVADVRTLAVVARAVLADPLGLAAALGCYATAFGLRTWAWQATLPRLSPGQSWAALHVSLLGNHVLPFRLGEALRVTSVLRRTDRTDLPTGDVLATAVTLRLADLVAVLLLALATAPALVFGLTGQWTAAAAAVLLASAAVALGWLGQLARGGAPVRLPGPGVALSAVGAWVLESAVVWEVARTAGVAISPGEAVAVTAATIAAQAVAVTPGGIGSYEAAATAMLGALGVPPAQAFAVAVATHAVKTAYALAVGAVALVVPAPTYWGHLRLPRAAPPRPPRRPVPDDAPVVVFVPVYNEAGTAGEVVRRLPASVNGRRVLCVVVDDGSTDASAALAAGAGALVVRQPRNLGLGAAVRRGLAEASAQSPAAVVYLDADLEYLPEEVGRLAAPVLAAEADYVVGSRFAGGIRRMRPYRRLGNLVLTAWVRWLTRRRDLTDGQSGFRAFSPQAAADAEVVHDYNYAQVLTLDLLAKGYAYGEVPISYAFRESGESFVKLGRYLRKVVPAVHRELNVDTPLPP
jgi:uncharacterized membrane protein YbhN (UPF0104 family)